VPEFTHTTSRRAKNESGVGTAEARGILSQRLEPVHREIYRALQIPYEVMKPVRTWSDLRA